MFNTLGREHLLVFIVIAILSLLIADLSFKEWKLYQSNLPGLIKPKKQLVVGILTSRENFKMRAMLRKTWLQTITSNHDLAEQVVYKFIVGERDCDIHLKNRKDPYTCERNRPVLPNDLILPIILPEEIQKDLNGKDSFRWNISLTVLYPIVVKQLGLHASVLLDNVPVKVILFDERREEDVVSSKFSLIDPGRIQNSYRYQAVEPVILPRNFIGSLRIRVDIHDKLNTSYMKNNRIDFCDIVLIDDINELDMHVSLNKEKGIPMLTFGAAVFDADSLRKVIEEQSILDQHHQTHNKAIKLRIKEEERDFNDLLFVNVTDVYRNLPNKLLKFHAWVSNSMPAHYILKTDDDCYVDVEEIFKRLKSFKNQKKIWWSNFRDNWVVERFGKWAENSFRSEVYPSFACGAGNVVSGDIGEWIARNEEDLASFQGEDVSMGIWLSAISVNYVVDDRWQCNKNCDKSSLVIPELTENEIDWFWNNKIACGNPCGCS